MNSQNKNAYITFALSILFQILLFCLSNNSFYGGNDSDSLPSLPLRLERQFASRSDTQEGELDSDEIEELTRRMQQNIDNLSNEELHSKIKRKRDELNELIQEAKKRRRIA